MVCLRKRKLDKKKKFQQLNISYNSEISGYSRETSMSTEKKKKIP